MKHNNIIFYHQHAKQLAAQYTSISFEQVHSDWLCEIPIANNMCVLDIGAGAGRDAKALAEQGCHVTAIEPAEDLLLHGKQYTGKQVTWVNDRLPKLLTQTTQRYELILVSAVWMHLTDSEQHQSLKRCSDLLSREGCLVITLRHGTFQDARTHFPTNDASLIKLANLTGLTLTKNTFSQDKLNRLEIQWQTLVFQKQ